MYFLPKKKYNLSEKMMIRDTSLNLRFFFSKYGFSINLIFFIVLTILNGNNTRLQEAIEKTSNIQDQSNLAMSYWVKNCSSYGKQAALHPYNRSFDEGDSNYVIDFDENNLVNSLETLSKLSEWSLDRIRPNPTKNEKRKVFCLKNNSTIEAFRTAYQGGYEITGAWEDAQNSRSESAFRGRTQTRIEEVRKANTKRSRNISASIVNGSFCDDHNCK